jgi:hypothetical protein
MAITTANELRTAVQNWAVDTAGNILTTDRLNECIALAEAWLNRKLRTRGMEATMGTTALSSGAASLPAGFLAFKELRFDGAIDYTLQPKSLEFVRAMDTDDAGNPRYFAVTSTQVICWPTAGSIKGTYFKALTSLSGLTTTGNWLLTSHPDLYLAATLTEASLYMVDDAKAVMWRQRATATLEELNKTDEADSFDGGVLAIRAR